MSRKVSTTANKRGKTPTFVRNVVPDRLDLRDRPYQPAIQIIPGQEMQRHYALPVLNLVAVIACTGSSLSIEVHRCSTPRGARLRSESLAFDGLYSMARRR